jgi:L-amino acid N-acyltransferase YncA
LAARSLRSIVALRVGKRGQRMQQAGEQAVRIDNTAPSAVIRPALAADAAALARIYNPYIRDTIITFEEEPVDAAAMAGRVDEAAVAALPWLVAEADGVVLGYAYASKWKGRCAYRHSVESTVYLDPAQTGRGLGGLLYGALIDRLRVRSTHAVIGGIALPNDASVALHEKLGFRKVAQFPEVGFKFGRWIDVGYWQLLM